MSEVEMILSEKPVFTPIPHKDRLKPYGIPEEEIIAHERLGTEICPECGAKLIHEAGCVRCLCGWSRC